ncbi:hypothetical protein EMCRGX_G027729 [Ephydatia muelleri]
MARWLRRAAPGDRPQFSAPGWKPGTYCIQQTALELVKYQQIICQLFAPDGSSLEFQALAPAGTTPPSGAHGASHQQVLGPRLWWRTLCQGLAMCCTSGPVISMNSHHSTISELTPLYDQRTHTTLRTTSSHHSMISNLTPLYDQRAHTILRLANSHHSTNNELTRLYDQQSHTTLRPASSHHSTNSELTRFYD